MGGHEGVHVLIPDFWTGGMEIRDIAADLGNHVVNVETSLWRFKAAVWVFSVPSPASGVFTVALF